MASTIPRGPRQVFSAFQWSMKGLKACYQHEASFRLEVYLAVILVPLGFWLGQGGVEKIVLVTFPILVLAAELLNSAIEAVVDRISLDRHPLSNNAKDMGSAAQTVALLMVGTVWAVILLG